jgi:heterodisulfide reductase subunit B
MTYEMTAPAGKAAEPLSKVVLDALGDNIFRCYQCVKCTSGCPVADEFDLMPNQVMRGLQLGDPMVLDSKAIWLCASCQTCATRCPQGIDVTGVMDALRIEARRRNIRPAIPEIARFNALFMFFVKLLGRIPELGLMFAYNLALRQPLRDLGMGLRMLKRGKLKLLPHFARPPRKVTPLDDPKDKVAYFPGCAALSSAADYDRTIRRTAETLGIELVEPPGWVCCGATPAHATDSTLATALPLRTMSTIEQMGLDTVTSPCSNCFARLKAAEYTALHDPDALRKAEAHNAQPYHGKVKVQHILDTLMERASVADIRRKVERPLDKLRVACYYGCLITRPSKITGAENPEYPMKMDYLVRALGAETVDWSYKTECCGGALGVTQPRISARMSRKIVKNALDCGAEAIVTMCPMCHMNVDARQPEMDLDGGLPVFHGSQLMTLAFGDGPKAAYLEKNVVDPRPFLESKGLLGNSRTD